MNMTMNMKYVQLDEQEYPAREIFIDEEHGTRTVSVESMFDALYDLLYSDKTDETEEDACKWFSARETRDTIFTFVPDELINDTDENIRNYISRLLWERTSEERELFWEFDRRKQNNIKARERWSRAVPLE